MRILYHPKARVQLGFEPYVAPDDFDRASQPVDIYDVFRAYYSAVNRKAKFIYSYSDGNYPLTLTPTRAYSFRYGYTSGGVDYVVDVPLSGSPVTIFNETSTTNRWVIVNHTGTSMMTANPPLKSIWIYCGNKINRVTSVDSMANVMKYIHISSLSNLTSAGVWCYARLTGTLHIPSTWTSVENAAFYKCNLITGSLNLPDSIITIGSQSFEYCSGLTGTLTIPDTTTTIGTSAFQSCTGFTAISIGSSVTSIGNYAFQNCTGFTGTLTFPDSLTTLGVLSFAKCTGFTGTLTISSGITSIGEGSFYNDRFNAIDVSANSGYHSHDNVLYQESDHLAIHGLFSYSGTLTIESDTLRIGNYCFTSNARTGSLTIPDSVTSIGVSSFSNITSYTGTITFGTGLLTIQDAAFQSCKFTGTVTFPDALTTIGRYCFRYSSGITSIVFSDSIKSIGIEAFNQMPALASIDLGDGIQTIGSYAFEKCRALTGSLVIPASLTNLGGLVFQECYFTSITSSSTNYPAEDNVLYDVKTSGKIIAVIGANKYSGTLTLKSGTTEIAGYCFYGSGSYRTGTLTLLSTITTIGANAFNGSSGFNRCDAYKTAAPTIGSNGLLLGGTARELHIISGSTGYNVAPWTTTSIFSSIIQDL